MTGAGSATPLVFGHEDSFMGSLVDSDDDGTPDLFGFGRKHSITELDLDNDLEDLSEGDSVWDVESVKQNAEGAVSVEAVVSSDVHNEVEKIVFNDGGTAMKPGLASSARVFVGVNYATGTSERTLYGCIPLSYDINYDQGSMVTYTLSMAYADEEPDSSPDLSTATRASDDSGVPYHGFTLDIDGTSVEDEQSVTLSISDIARFQRGSDPKPLRAVIASPSATLDATATYTGPSRLDIARGSSTGTLPDNVDSVSGTIELADAAGTISTYNLSGMSPANYSWNEVVSKEDTTDQIQVNITDEQAVTVA